MLREHKEEINELHKDLHEKDEKIEQLIEDYEDQMAVSECGFLSTSPCNTDCVSSGKGVHCYTFGKHPFTDAGQKTYCWDELENYSFMDCHILQRKEESHKSIISHMEEALAEKRAELDTLQAEMKTERNSMEEKARAEMSRQFQAEKRRHVDEVEGISHEWEIERKVHKPSSPQQ